MSFLAPAFLAGLFAVSLPLIFHLIRRTPRGRRTFSSLMFLTPSPPRLTRRSTLDNILLLILRAAVLILVALAFARPFLRERASLGVDDAVGRRVAILVDTSASMRRGDLWPQAVAKAREILAGLEAADDVALYTFDAHPTAVVDFNDESSLTTRQRSELIAKRLEELGPSWAGTDLGSALVTVADALDAGRESDRIDASPQIILISDLQTGSRIEALQAYQWPEDVQVAVHPLVLAKTTNATLALLTAADDPDELTNPRVRVTNAANSSDDQFYVAWSSASSRPNTDDAAAVNVPPGESRVVRLPRPVEKLGCDRLILTGDASSFDNEFYVVPERQEELDVLYIGGDSADDPAGLRYYWDLAWAETPRRKVNVVGLPTEPPSALYAVEPPRMVVATEAVSPERQNRLTDYVKSGGTLLIVPKTGEVAASLIRFSTDVEIGAEENQTRSGQYAMLGEIDFQHPLFAPFASPRYNDFTKIHFWEHRHVTLKNESAVRVLARFDDGSPAFWQERYGEGNVYVLTSGWHPEDSELALSSKFVPLLTGLLDQAGGGTLELASYTVGETISLPSLAAQAAPAVVHRPDGTPFQIARDSRSFDHADEPGIYRIEHAGATHEFAVNLPAAESDTAMLDTDRLEQYGVRWGSQPTRTERIERERQLRDVELEGRQKIWRWFIVAALGVITLETWVAGRKSRPLTDDSP